MEGEKLVEKEENKLMGAFTEYWEHVEIDMTMFKLLAPLVASALEYSVKSRKL